MIIYYEYTQLQHKWQEYVEEVIYVYFPDVNVLWLWSFAQVHTRIKEVQLCGVWLNKLGSDVGWRQSNRSTVWKNDGVKDQLLHGNVAGEGVGVVQPWTTGYISKTTRLIRSHLICMVPSRLSSDAQITNKLSVETLLATMYGYG